LKPGDLRRSLRRLGLRAGDVISLGGDGEKHYEITDDRT
jgi:hypothetical protein